MRIRKVERAISATSKQKEDEIKKHLWDYKSKFADITYCMSDAMSNWDSSQSPGMNSLTFASFVDQSFEDSRLINKRIKTLKQLRNQQKQNEGPPAEILSPAKSQITKQIRNKDMLTPVDGNIMHRKRNEKREKYNSTGRIMKLPYDQE